MFFDAKMMRYGPSYFSPFERSMIEFQERQRENELLMQNIRSYGAIDSPWAISFVRDQIDLSKSYQPAIDVASIKPEIVTARDRLASMDHQRRFIDPLLNPDFVNRITGGVSSDLMRGVS